MLGNIQSSDLFFIGNPQTHSPIKDFQYDNGCHECKNAGDAETPELICTTVPPAKSRAPIFPNQPPAPQTQCAKGLYTKVDQSNMKTKKVLNFMRSAKAPVMRAGVIMANMAWKTINAWWGTVPA